jgi:hypothetical protein
MRYIAINCKEAGAIIEDKYLNIFWSRCLVHIITQSCTLVQSLHKVQNEWNIRSVTIASYATTSLVLMKDESNTSEASLVASRVPKGRYNQV